MNLLTLITEKKEGFTGTAAGCCSIEHPLLKDYRENIRAILPEARFLVVIAAAHTRSALRSANLQVKQYDTIYAYNRVRDLSLSLAREFEAAGHAAVAVPAFIPIDMLGPGKGMVGEICWRTAGVAAGLGFIGKNNLLITEDFGPGVRVGGVLTDFPLQEHLAETRGQGRNNCGGCTACIKNCPTGALGEFSIDRKKCGDHIFAYGLRRFTGYLGELLGANEDDRRTLLKSPAARELWQNFMSGCYYYCWECQSSCPQYRKN